jgi:superfamily II DNA or RNA helicase
MSMLSAAIPEPGQLVTVRSRQFVVSDIRASALPAQLSAKGVESSMHLVSLSSVEDDGLGEEPQVIWEIEPGVRVFEKSALPAPSGFDDPKHLDAFVDAVRWGVVSSADIHALQSPFRSGIDIEDYQLDPVVRALRMPRVNLLIADDVGLGKTIEAGLVVQELLLRHRARGVLVICPASLQIQWKDQMRDKFGLEFRIIDAQMMKDLRRERGLHVNPWNHFPRLITSIDFIKRDRPMRLFRELLPQKGKPAYPRRFDLLIVDEAHNIAPSGTGYYAMPSLRTKTIQTLAPHFEHRLFLTATPHNGYQESFTALLELLDNQRFAKEVRPIPAQLAAIMVRRLKSELPPKWDGTPRFPQRRIAPIEIDYAASERDAHKLLHRYSELRRKAMDSGAESYAAEFVLKLLKKRLFSSPEAFRTTLQKHIETLRESGKKEQKKRRSLTLGILKRRLEEIEDDYADDEVYEQGVMEAIDNASMAFNALSEEEETALTALLDWASEAANRADAKAKALIDYLNGVLRPDGKWNNERVLIFTEYRATQNWLYDLLTAEGFAKDDRLMLIYGGMSSDDREGIKAAFQAAPEKSPVRLLLATDAASEGIDLQNHCHRLVHYEIPWNPNRLEQRNGRLDRHGQKSPNVDIHHFVPRGFEANAAGVSGSPGKLDGDLEFLMRAVMKVEQIREDLGKVGPVIAQQVEEAMLGKRRRLNTAEAEASAAAPRRQLKFERNLREQIARLHEQLQNSRRELRVSPENIHHVVSVALSLAKQPPLKETELSGVWPDPQGERDRSPVFAMPPLEGVWARCAEGLPHPHTHEIRPITFDYAVAQGRDDVVLIHLNHRLVQMAARLLRAEIWAADADKYLNRVTARRIPDSASTTPVVVAYGRLVVLGGDQHRLHEEIIAAGGALREGRFKRLGVTEINDLLAAATEAPAPDGVKKRLSDMWETLQSPLFRSLEARMKDRTKNLQKFMDERQTQEIRDITDILRQLAESISAELGSDGPEQLLLWPDPEREQFEKNREGLKARLEEIPREIERETDAIGKRYRDPVPRLFPICVSFLVPDKIRAEEGGTG